MNRRNLVGALVVVAAIGSCIVACLAGPGGVPSSGNGEPCLSTSPQGGETFLHDCSTPTPAPVPTATYPDPLATSQSQMSLAADNEKNNNFANDQLWLPAIWMMDSKASNHNFDQDIVKWGTTHPFWELLWVSSSTYSEASTGNGAVDRAYFFDQCENCFSHSGDPADATALPGNATCTLYWQPDGRGESGGYKIYFAATTGTSTIDSLAGSVGTGVTTATISGLSNTAGTYYFYIDTIGISTTLTGGMYTHSTTPQVITLGANTDVRPFTQLHIHDTVKGDEDVQVTTCTTSAGFCSSGIKVVLTKDHSGGGSQTVTSEWAYSGVDPLDSSQTQMANATGTFYGTRLGSSGDTAESLSAFPVSCKPSTTPGSGAPILSDIQITTSPNVYPTSGSTPAANSTVTISGSIQESVSSPLVQVTPSLSYEYNGNQGAGTSVKTPTQTWSHAGTGATLTWTLASPWPTFTSSPTAMGDGYVSVDMQVAVPSPSPATTTQWFQIGGKNNRQNEFNYAQLNAYIRQPCAYQNSIGTEWWMDYEVINNLQNPGSAGNLQRAFEVDEPDKGAQIAGDISNTVDTEWLPQNDQAANCGFRVASGVLGPWITGTHSSSFGNWADSYEYESKDGYEAGLGDPAAGGSYVCTNCTWSNMQFGGIRLFDGFPSTAAGGLNTRTEWVGQALTALQDSNLATPILGYFASDATSSLSIRYFAESSCLLLTSYSSNGQPLDFCGYDQLNSTFGDVPLFVNDYAPVGPPLIPIPPVPNPSSSTIGTALSGIFNSTDNMMERQFLNGVVLFCGASGMPTGFKSFPQTVYLLGNDTGPINDGGGAMARTYTPITRWPTSGNCANNTSAIIVYLPY